MHLQDPKTLYNSVITRMDQSLNALKDSPATGTDELDNDRKQAVEVIEKYRVTLEKELKTLEKQAIWDRFTIAVYGETNAGKSTLIETLRIMLREETKAKTQEEYRRTAARIDYDPDRLAAAQDACRQLRVEDGLKTEELETLRRRQTAEEARLLQAVEDAKAAVLAARARLSFLRRLFLMFSKLPEEQHLRQETAALHAARSAHQQADAQAIATLTAIRDKLKAEEQYVTAVENRLTELCPHEDGGIIGNGRSDFTLSSQSYHFDVEGRSITLIDVPGIEGDEKKVSDEIMEAVQKAHAVLYVTRKPSLPNSGDGKQQGTIEKIQSHLKAQTEVYAVYNKGVTNPIALKGKDLISQDEAGSLETLEKGLHERLPGKFQRCISISAMPAFFAVADCLSPINSNARNRQKFLDAMSPDDLLQKSRFSDFGRFITHTLAEGYKDKIAAANRQKVKTVLEDAKTDIAALATHFSQSHSTLTKQLASTRQQLDDRLDSFERTLKTRCEDSVASVRSARRQAVYEFIDQDVSNDDFKEFLSSQVDVMIKETLEKLKSESENHVKEFEEDIERILNKFKNNTYDIISRSLDFMKSGENKFELNIKIDDGINVKSLLASVAGAALLLTNPPGQIYFLIAAVAGLLLSFVKSIWGFFSSDYKKQQQRKSTDEDLKRISKNIEEKIKEYILSVNEEIKSSCSNLKERIGKSANTIKSISDSMHSTAAELKKAASTF